MRRLRTLLVAAASVGGAVAFPVPAHAGLAATVTGGTAHVTTEDWCDYSAFDAPPPDQRRWVSQLELDLVMRVDERQRTVSIAAVPGYHYMSCSSWTLPTMTFTGVSGVGPSMTQESVDGSCRGLDGLATNFECTLSFAGRAPVTIRMRLESIYQECAGEGSPVPQPCQDTDVVAGEQNLIGG